MLKVKGILPPFFHKSLKKRKEHYVLKTVLFFLINKMILFGVLKQLVKEQLLSLSIYI